MSSCQNEGFLNHLLNVSGICQGQWELILLTSDFQLQCKKIILNDMIPKSCIIGRADFAVSHDKENVCITVAQNEIRFPGLAHRGKDISKIALLTPLDLVAAVWGNDLIRKMFRSNTSGEDLVISTGADSAIFGI